MRIPLTFLFCPFFAFSFNFRWIQSTNQRSCLHLNSKLAEVTHFVPPEIEPIKSNDWKFFDVAKIFVKGGDGGKGCMAMRREFKVDRGGPCGGNGGNGGSVLVVGNKNMNTLSNLRRSIHHRAKNGGNGQGDSCHGAKGSDCIIQVPIGTVIRDEDGNYAGEIRDHEELMLVARGGKGGRGNEHFKTPRNNAPQFAELGEHGVERWLKIELKLFADVGIIGVPNAGKSTLLAACSNARPKIANYPFTTIVPNLGVCDLSDDVESKGMVLIDIPGLMDGAHKGRGLGMSFLRHIKRCRLLVHVLSGESEDPVGDFKAVNQEMQLYNTDLLHIPQVVVLNKVDSPEVALKAKDLLEQLRTICNHTRVFSISALSGLNVKELTRRVGQLLASLPPVNATAVDDVPLESSFDETESEGFSVNKVPVSLDGMGRKFSFQIVSHKIEKLIEMTNWDYFEASLRFQRILEAMGVNDALRSEGIQEGDSVTIGNFEFEFSDELNNSWVDDYDQGLYGREGKLKI